MNGGDTLAAAAADQSHRADRGSATDLQHEGTEQLTTSAGLDFNVPQEVKVQRPLTTGVDLTPDPLDGLQVTTPHARAQAPRGVGRRDALTRPDRAWSRRLEWLAPAWVDAW